MKHLLTTSLILLIFIIGGMFINKKTKDNTVYTFKENKIVYKIEKTKLIYEVNSKIDLMSNIKYDNCNVTIEGTYDNQKEGIYKLNYILENDTEKIKKPIILIIASNIRKTLNNNDIYTIDNATYIDEILIVNKTYGLDKSFVPVNSNRDICKECLDSKVMEQFFKMQADALLNNLNLYISSGYRSYEKQNDLYNAYITEDGQAIAETYSARPGHSEHQTGLAFDLNSVESNFINTSEGKWINQNCYKYGFIIRYPKEKEKITGYKYEPWHLRYVGKKLANILYNNGDWLTLEEYFKIESAYKS